MATQKDPLAQLFARVDRQHQRADDNDEFVRVVKQRLKRSVAKRIGVACAFACLLLMTWSDLTRYVTPTLPVENVLTVRPSGVERATPHTRAASSRIDWAGEIDYAWLDLEYLLDGDDEVSESSGPHFDVDATSQMAVAAYFVDITQTKENR